MCTGMHSGIFSLVQAVVLLAISFFILLAGRKSDSQNIKIFGYVIAVLLWVSAALVFGKAIFDRHPMFHRMHTIGECMGKPMGRTETPQPANQALPAK
jgi:hypothetical protein